MKLKVETLVLVNLGLYRLRENLGMLLCTRLNYTEIESKKQQQFLAIRERVQNGYVNLT